MKKFKYNLALSCLAGVGCYAGYAGAGGFVCFGLIPPELTGIPLEYKGFFLIAFIILLAFVIAYLVDLVLIFEKKCKARSDNNGDGSECA